jgi:arylsulfatase
MADQPQRPHILLITTDQQRGDCTGIDGHPILQTPHLDQLANEGVYFSRAYSPCPVCVPARMVIMTGQSPHRVGYFGNSGHGLAERETLPRQLGRLGYQTQLIGKGHFSPQRARLGFDNTIINESGRMREGDDYHRWLLTTPYAGQQRATSIGNNDVFARRSVVPETHHVTTWTANECIDFLDRRDPTSPFFLWMSFSKPHSPYDPPEPYDTLYELADIPPPIAAPGADFLPPQLREMPLRYDWDRMSPKDVLRTRQHYLGEITHIDHQIGRVLGALRWKGLWDNTLVLFTSDHGDMLGDYGLFFKSQFFEGSGRVPMILRPPRSWEGVVPGLRFEKPVSLVDVLPTLVAGAERRPTTDDRPPTAEVDGVSLLPALAGEDPIGERVFHGEIGSAAQRHHCLTDGRLKYMWFRLGGAEYLFDLAEDPRELHNLARDEARVAPWRARLIALLQARDDEALQEGRLAPTPYTPAPERALRAADPFGRRPY